MTVDVWGPRADWEPDELEAWKALTADERRFVRIIGILPSEYIANRAPRSERELLDRMAAAGIDGTAG